MNAAARIHSGAPGGRGKATENPAGLSEPAGLCSALQTWSGACSPFILARLTGTGKRRSSPVWKVVAAVPHPQTLTPPPFHPRAAEDLRGPPSCCLSFRSNPKGWFLVSSTGAADPFPWRCVQTIREEP